MKIKYFVVVGGVMLALAGGRASAQSITVTIQNGSGSIGGSGIVNLTISGTASSGVQADVLLPTSVFDPMLVDNDPPFPADNVMGCTSSRFPSNEGFRLVSALPATPPAPEGTRRLRLAVIDNNSEDRVTEGTFWSCNLPIKADAAAGPYTLMVVNTSATDSQGEVIPTTGQSGTFDVSTGPTSTPTEAPPTSTPTPTVTPTATNTSPVTSTPTATSTPTRTRTPTITNTRKPSNDEDDGCQMVAPANATGQAGWLLLIPAAVLIWRKRSR